jgi:membrane-associated HD superfamily phosphohydrolase
VILLKGTTFGLGVVILVIGAQFLFVAIRKPYNCGDYRRPLINLATTIVALTAVLCNSILTSFQALQLFAPFLICILLTITLFCNSFYFIRELREVFAEDNLKFGNLKKGLVEKVFKLEEEESIQ